MKVSWPIRKHAKQWRGPVVAVVALLSLGACALPQDVIGAEVERKVSAPDTPLACRAYENARRDYESVRSASGVTDNNLPPLREPVQRMLRQVDILTRSSNTNISFYALMALDEIRKATNPQLVASSLTALAKECS